jgi:hypothetical protein
VKKTGEAAPRLRVLRPHVNVTDEEPPHQVQEKKAEFTACPVNHPGQYPLETFEQVKRASAYFGEYGGRFTLDARREFCQNLVRRADALSIEVDRTVRKYASTSYAATDEVKAAMEDRRRFLDDGDKVAAAVLSKLEENITTTAPELFCAVLGEFDKAVGLGRYYDQGVYDPYFSTYGCKTAQDKGSWSWIDGNTYLTYEDLKNVVKTRAPVLTKVFGEDFVKELRADPTSIFDSLPMDQKRMVAAMATDNAPGTNLST